MYIPKVSYDKGRIKADRKIVIFSGAGISQPSGIATFRDSDGTWNNHNVDDVCNERTWKKNFELVHKFYNERREQLKEVEPNIAHEVVAKIVEKYGKDNVFNITQNVDNLFERAGTDALHVHGSLTAMECEACGEKWEIGHEPFDTEKDRCPKCDSLKGVRPSIVFFGGQAPMYSYMLRAFDYTMNPETIVVIIGTMGNVVNVESMVSATPCRKILCNMAPSPDINVKKVPFDKVYYESIETAIHKIEKDIEEMWNV